MSSPEHREPAENSEDVPIYNEGDPCPDCGECALEGTLFVRCGLKPDTKIRHGLSCPCCDWQGIFEDEG